MSYAGQVPKVQSPTPHEVDVVIELIRSAHEAALWCGHATAETGVRFATGGERARAGSTSEQMVVSFVRCTSCSRRWEGAPRD
jgi:hypothetical protein